MRKPNSLLVIIIIGLVLGLAIGSVTYQQAKQHLTEKVSSDVRRLGDKLEAELSRYSSLPAVLASDPRLLKTFITATDQQYQATNALLQEWAKTLSADTIYLINPDGLTLAASNWQNENSFVGENYAYRPYFQQAIAGQPSAYFALGASSEKRGYYFSAPVYNQKQIIGVLALKVDLSIIEHLERSLLIDYAIIDEHGVVFYSSKASWLYHSLITLSPQQQAQIRLSRRYGYAPLSPLTDRKQLIELDKREINDYILPDSNRKKSYLTSKHDMLEAGWIIYGFTPIYTAYQYVGQAMIIYITIFMLFFLAITSWRQTSVTKRKLAQLNDKLEQLVIDRTQSLMESNQQLRDNIQLYELTQAELKQTQNELVQAAKLAMLGELSASINHEINQPLAAMRTYAENSRKLMEKERYDAVAKNLNEIINLNQMVADIIARFKVFARKANSNYGHASAADSIRSAIGIIRNKLIKQGVILRVDDLPADIMVQADAVQFEQVLVNLLHNAIQALANAPSPQIGVHLAAINDHVEIRIWDNGPGLDRGQKKRIFSPFYTTKQDGLGLGLTISRRIIDSFSGTLTVQDHVEGGAEFVITLPRIKEEDS